MTSGHHPILRLDNYIDSEAQDLANYAQYPDAKDSVISKRNNDLLLLTSIRNDLDSPYSDILREVGREMAQLIKADPEISIIMIEIRIRPNGHNRAYINLDTNI